MYLIRITFSHQAQNTVRNGEKGGQTYQRKTERQNVM